MIQNSITRHSARGSPDRSLNSGSEQYDDDFDEVKYQESTSKISNKSFQKSTSKPFGRNNVYYAT
jgi:hypothetical protein